MQDTSRVELSRLRGRKIVDHVLRKGKVWKGKQMLVRMLPGAPRHPAANPALPGIFFGSLASAKLDKSAVRRNRMRRRCREAWRVTLRGYRIPSAYQLLISPRSSSLKAPFAEIQNDVRRFLSTLPNATAATTQAQ